MNRKGAGPIGAIFLFIIFLIFWLVWLSRVLSEVGNSIVQENALSGVEAFAFGNLNLLVLVVVILALIVYQAMGGSQ